MELLTFLEKAAALGMSPVAIVALGVLVQQVKMNVLFDKRIAILESKATK